ncbi:MAG: hypothetical protein U5R49_07125 [Deltaproteobacteria bacterium]|nr:hypothetical protein [Deltaproteobacteria bacterium]
MPTSVRKMDQLLVNELGFTRRTGRHQIYVLELGAAGRSYFDFSRGT